MTLWMLQTFAGIGLFWSALFALVMLAAAGMSVLSVWRRWRQRRARRRYSREACAQAEAQLARRPRPGRREPTSTELWAEIESWPEMRGRAQ